MAWPLSRLPVLLVLVAVPCRVAFLERPIAKVVRLLQDMAAELSADLADDKAVHEKLDCWCTSNEREKTASIEAGKAKKSQLESVLGEAQAQVAEMQSKRDESLDEVNKDQMALQEASSLRMKASKRFHLEEVNLVEALKAVDQAITVLGKHNVALAQVRGIAQQLEKAQVLDFGRRSLSATDALALRSFLVRAQSGDSFLSAPAYQSYSPQSSQIFGVLTQMKEDFASDLTDLRAAETQDGATYSKLKTAKEAEIAASKTLLADLDQRIALVKEKHAQAFQELEDVSKQLTLDVAFMAKLTERCSVTEEEFAKRVKDRNEEITAVQETVKILNNDTAFETFGKTVNSFLQVRASNSAARRLSDTVAVLVDAAAATGEPGLSLLAARAQLDGLEQVQAEVEKMVAHLEQQQKDESLHRDWCIAELAKNERSSAAGHDKKNTLLTKRADFENTVEYLKKELGDNSAAVEKMQAQMKKASENREAENAQYQQTVSDQRLAQMFLGKAVARMKKVYAMLQEDPGAAHTQMSASSVDPGNGPARFKQYAKHSAGARVIALIDEIISDSRKTEDDAIKSEQDDQTTYEAFMKDSNAAITALGETMTNLKRSLAMAKEDLLYAKTDLKSTVGRLQELHEESGSLHQSCDLIVSSFDARQVARTAEIAALREAKTILSGTK